MPDGRRTGTDGQRFLLRGVIRGGTEVNPGVLSGVELFNPRMGWDIFMSEYIVITDRRTHEPVMVGGPQ